MNSQVNLSDLELMPSPQNHNAAKCSTGVLMVYKGRRHYASPNPLQVYPNNLYKVQ